MTTTAFDSERLLQPARGLSGAVAAVANAFQAIIEVFAEAEYHSSAARDRFPLAD